MSSYAQFHKNVDISDAQAQISGTVKPASRSARSSAASRAAGRIFRERGRDDLQRPLIAATALSQRQMHIPQRKLWHIIFFPQNSLLIFCHILEASFFVCVCPRLRTVAVGCYVVLPGGPSCRRGCRPASGPWA